jgi:hypothetical protein
MRPEALAKTVVRLEKEVGAVKLAASRYLDRDYVIAREDFEAGTSGEYLEATKVLENDLRRAVE